MIGTHCPFGNRAHEVCFIQWPDSVMVDAVASIWEIASSMPDNVKFNSAGKITT